LVPPQGPFPRDRPVREIRTPVNMRNGPHCDNGEGVATATPLPAYALARPPYKHAARASGIRRFGPCFAAAKPPMECGNLLPLSGLQPPANTPVRAFRSPNSDLRSPTPCVPDVRSSAFSRLAQYRPRQEPRKTRNTRKESENRTGGRRGNGDVPCNDECRESNDERSPKSQIDASPSALAPFRSHLPTPNSQLPFPPARPDLPSPISELRLPLRVSASLATRN